MVYTRSSVVPRASVAPADDSGDPRAATRESAGEEPASSPATGRPEPTPAPGRRTPSDSSQADAPGVRETERQSPARDDPAGLDELELAQIRVLSQRDREVRQHEQAHAAVGGGLAGAPSFDYERGPDGRQYAVSGEVPIDASGVPGDPEATLRKMEQVRRAALAPADPSTQDRMVAARATQLILQARAELQAQLREARMAQAQTNTGPADDRQVRQNQSALNTYNQLSRIGEAEPTGRVPDLTELIA
ncbi:MAG: hypothetical protein D6758_09485 [Gammaproteobacteria bacterium]|nr:MAG: hypothetical protein D6758_09485 [Gammaproteobacteria bacterium]